MHRLLLAAGTTLALGAAQGTALGATPVDRAAVVATYANIAHAMYQDALTEAEQLRAAIGRLAESPGDATLADARAAWLAARVPYQQTEAYRFGNPIVDDWEGRVNAWPLDEGLIDYVAASYGDESDVNDHYTATVIAHEQITASGQPLDASTIDADLLRSLHEIDEVEANVATGYHAIEFLLWGQDLNGTGPGAGERPATDFDAANCTGGNCDRRVAYLTTAADMVVADLEEMVGHWAEGGEARAAVEGDPDDGLRAMLTGLGSLSYGELAGERMQLGLLLHDPEEEHDCFSDNTHNSHYYDIVGMLAVYDGRYQRVDGSVVEGPSLAGLVAAADPELAKSMQDALDATLADARVLKDTADSGKMAYDQMLAEDNPEGNAIVQTVIDSLKAQTGVIEQVVAALDLGSLAFEGSDSLDDPEAVFQ
ncbi:MAG: imelysin family protein [Geminicoccales bacterium]